jgi:hypothetical protein
VPTWKSTEAAPTPISDGPRTSPLSLTWPSALSPWQDEQPMANSCRPSSICVDEAAWTFCAVVGASAAYAPPAVNSTATSTAMAASGCRRRVDSSPPIREPRGRPGNDLGTSLLVT